MMSFGDDARECDGCAVGDSTADNNDNRGRLVRRDNSVFHRVFMAAPDREDTSAARAAVLIFGMIYTYLNPAFVCPDEYRQYVSAEDEEYLLRLWGGFYGHTPLFATRISVIYADEEKIQVEVDYSIFGSRVMSHGPDGIGEDKPLGGW